MNRHQSLDRGMVKVTDVLSYQEHRDRISPVMPSGHISNTRIPQSEKYVRVPFTGSLNHDNSICNFLHRI